jgi:hypothetical protein
MLLFITAYLGRGLLKIKQFTYPNLDMNGQWLVAYGQQTQVKQEGCAVGLNA